MMHIRKLIAQKLPQNQVEEILNAVIDRIKKTCKPQQVYLFGSASENKMTDQSDIDVLIIFSDFNTLKESKKKFYTYQQKINWPVDAIFVTEEYFEKHRKIGGICQYCFEKGLSLNDKLFSINHSYSE